MRWFLQWNWRRLRWGRWKEVLQPLEMNAASSLNTLLGRRIRKARLEADLSQKEVAAIVGILPALLEDIECGRIRPQSGTLLKLCEALNVSLKVLLSPSA